MQNVEGEGNGIAAAVASSHGDRKGAFALQPFFVNIGIHNIIETDGSAHIAPVFTIPIVFSYRDSTAIRIDTELNSKTCRGLKPSLEAMKRVLWESSRLAQSTSINILGNGNNGGTRV